MVIKMAKTRVIERKSTGPIIEVEVEYTDEEIEDIFGDDPDCLVMALLRRARKAESKLEKVCLSLKDEEI